MDIEALLSEFTKESCECKRMHALTAKHICIAPRAIEKIPDFIKEFKCKRPFLLMDQNTRAAAGERVFCVLKESEISFGEYTFQEDSLEPDERAVGSAVMHFDSACDLVIAIGSGVLNDIGKILASTKGMPYFIVGTAPSMDGYASASSSVSLDGLKVSLPSKCADVIIGDIDILKNAPMEMLKAGLGDMLAKYISIAEWRIANVITGEYYCERVANLVRLALKRCTDNAKGLLNREEAAVKAVFEGLVIGGVAMAFAGVSRPASGVEHYISHILDMRGLEFGTRVDLHGTQCAAATYISASLYQALKVIVPDEKKALAYSKAFDYADWAEELKRFLGKGADTMIVLEKKEGKYDKKKQEARLTHILEKWDEILKIIEEEIPPLTWLDAFYDTVGLPKSLKEIGQSEPMLPMIFKATKDIRDKYVLSRLCFDLGIIDEII